MEDIFEILKGDFKITQIIIENFTVIDNELSIAIMISSNCFDNKIISFENVSGININSDYYACSNKSSIVIEDLLDAQMENIRYRIAISEDVMSFYCKRMRLN